MEIVNPNHILIVDLSLEYLLSHHDVELLVSIPIVNISQVIAIELERSQGYFESLRPLNEWKRG